MKSKLKSFLAWSIPFLALAVLVLLVVDESEPSYNRSHPG